MEIRFRTDGLTGAGRGTPAVKPGGVGILTHAWG